VRLNVQLSCELANVPPAAVDAFRASADRLFDAALERVKEVAAAYAEPAEPPRPVEARDACRGRHSLAARAARAVSARGCALRVRPRQGSVGARRGGGAVSVAGDRGDREGGGRVFCDVWTG
jgi:hypothetical protein